jgi:hypothetical protein
MTKPYSENLRIRAVEAVANGMSHRQAARLFRVGALVVGAGFDLELTHMVRVYGQFDGEFSDNARAFAGTDGVRLIW